MSTTPLPPLPPVEKEWCEDSHMYVQPVVPKYGSYEMQAYATAARADLEAENKRLREALRGAANYIDTLGGVSGSYRIELENKPDSITSYYTDRNNGAHAAKAP